MICTVTLACCAETLTRRASHNRINLTCPDQLCQTCGSKFGQVFFQDLRHSGEIIFEDLNSLMVEVNRRQALKPGAFHSKAETATATKKVNAGPTVHWCQPNKAIWLFQAQF